jgi:purine nucleoside permease
MAALRCLLMQCGGRCETDTRQSVHRLLYDRSLIIQEQMSLERGVAGVRRNHGDIGSRAIDRTSLIRAAMVARRVISSFP